MVRTLRKRAEGAKKRQGGGGAAAAPASVSLKELAKQDMFGQYALAQGGEDRRRLTMAQWIAEKLKEKWVAAAGCGSGSRVVISPYSVPQIHGTQCLKVRGVLPLLYPMIDMCACPHLAATSEYQQQPCVFLCSTCP
jgi:hypothetical protein